MESGSRITPCVLIVDDEPGVVALLRRTCTAAGYLVETASRGDRGAELALSNRYDLVILDIDLPGKDGLQVLKELRRSGRETPVLLLTIRSGEHAVAEGLDAGADDYLEKPFSLVELQARCRALLRRSPPASEPPMEYGDVRLDPARHQVAVGGRTVEIRPREYGLLEVLLRAEGGVVTRDFILRSVWHVDFDPGTNRVEVTVSRLRGLLADAGAAVRIETVRGVGYRLAS